MLCNNIQTYERTKKNVIIMFKEIKYYNVLLKKKRFYRKFNENYTHARVNIKR